MKANIRKLALISSFGLIYGLSNYTFSQTDDLYSDGDEDYFDDFYGSEEMVEIATGIKTQIYKAPAVASVITANEIENMGATDIDDILETVPGLHVSRHPTNYNPIYIFRGVHSTYNPQVLMLINGIPITNNFLGDRNQVWGGMPVEAIARIEVIRGPGSAVFGADAFSGVINIITKNSKDIRQNELSARIGQQDTQSAWLSFSSEKNELRYSTVIEYYKTEGSDKTITSDGQSFLDGVFGTNATLAPGALSLSTENIDLRSEANYLDFSIRAGYQLRDNVGVGAGLGEALDPTSRQKSERYNIDINYNRQYSKDLQLTSQASYFDTYQEIKNNYIIYPQGADVGFGSPFPDGFIGNPENSERQTRLNVSALYSGIDKHTLRLGLGYYYSDLYRTSETKNFGFGPTGEFIAPGSPLVDVSDTPYVFLRETDRTNKYIFAQDVWSIANDWELTAGIRHDDYSDFGSTTNPRLALVWSASLNMSTKLLYGKAFRAPSYADIGNINNPVALGNPDIKPEEMESIELAFDYHPGDGFGAVWSFYRYNWDDIIQYLPTENGNTAQNFGRQKAYGTEFELNWQLSDQISVSGNFSWSDAENDTNGTSVAYVPNQQWFLQLDWKISDTLKLNWRNHLVKDRQRNIGDLRSNIDDYWVSDMTLRWKPTSSPFELAMIGKNIFDDDAREPTFNNGAAVNIPNDLPLNGRTLFAELRYTFK